jgi:Protein of unknown function (DUF642)
MTCTPVHRAPGALAALALAGLCAALPASAANLIDSTYGAGAGSFELGSFTPGGPANFQNFQSLGAGASTLTGWQVGGVGVDWLSEPYYGASDGVHAVDLGWFDGGAGSVSITLPTVTGALYALSFDAAAVPGFPSYTNQGTVSAGSLSASFAPAFSAANDFTGQVFHTQNFNFTAQGLSTTLVLAAAVAGTAYGPVVDRVSVELISAPVPEPGTVLLWTAGLALLAGRRQRPAVLVAATSRS